jgi:hypothetical protein
VISKRAAIALDRGRDQGDLGVALAKTQIVHGQFALGRQLRAGQVGGAGLGSGLGAGHALADAAPEVGLPAGADADLIAFAA